jgi:protein-tyrosine-phosphatase
MTRTHRDAILALRPGLFSRVFTLAGFVRGLVDPSALSSPNADDSRCDDIPDPFGRGLEAYRLCARQLARLIEPLARFC